MSDPEPCRMKHTEDPEEQRDLMDENEESEEHLPTHEDPYSGETTSTESAITNYQKASGRRGQRERQ
ncbi:hypothetical protein F2P79_001205 [Pimephales promelas]|nr:hypothetical protein F2P79_001205 [Pimephales promelas]